LNEIAVCMCGTQIAADAGFSELRRIFHAYPFDGVAIFFSGAHALGSNDAPRNGSNFHVADECSLSAVDAESIGCAIMDTDR
jgi:hypothetical protein